MEHCQDFICALSFQHKHFTIEPVTLECTHCACYECVKAFKENTNLKKVNCLKCNQESSLEINYIVSDMIKNYMNLCSKSILDCLNTQYNDLFGGFKKKLNEMEEHVDVQVNYWKDEVEIRAESIKIEIDKIKDSLINKLDKVKIDFEEKILKNDSSEYYRKRLNEKLNINEIQVSVKELQDSINVLESINTQINFKLSEEIIPKSLLCGDLDYYFDNLMNNVDAKTYQIINLYHSPSLIYSLPNENLVVASNESKNLSIYNSDFDLIKTIDKINNKIFSPNCLISNGKTFIYILDSPIHQIIQTDLNFTYLNHFGGRGSTNQLLDKPSSIAYYENSIYICDRKNKRIQRLNEDLNFQKTYPLNYEPCSIKIINNVACVNSNAFAVLYHLNPFSFKIKINNVISKICTNLSWFYIFNKPDKCIECYDINGTLVGVKCLENEALVAEEKLRLFGFLGKKLLIGLQKSKKLMIL